MNCNINNYYVSNLSSNSSCSNNCGNLPINIVCKKIIIPTGQEILGIQGENTGIVKNFYIPKITENGIDLTEKTFSVEGKFEDNTTFKQNLEVSTFKDNFLLLKWTLNEEVTKKSGVLKIIIKAIDNSNFIWETFIGNFYISSGL